MGFRWWKLLAGFAAIALLFAVLPISHDYVEKASRDLVSLEGRLERVTYRPPSGRYQSRSVQLVVSGIPGSLRIDGGTKQWASELAEYEGRRISLLVHHSPLWGSENVYRVSDGSGGVVISFEDINAFNSEVRHRNLALAGVFGMAAWIVYLGGRRKGRPGPAPPSR